jgi:hypothetical protein
MAIVKEWNCLEHGEFESSHPICPNFGCDSQFVKREIRTAPGIRSATMKRFDAGIRKSADMMNLSDLRTAREGEAAYGGDAGKKLGAEVLWGDTAVRRAMNGRGFSDLVQTAQQPVTVTNRSTGEPMTYSRNNGMAEAAEAAGITRRVLPRAGEVSAAKDTPKPKAQAMIE